MKNILEVRDLKISFKTFFGEVEAVRGIDFDVETNVEQQWVLLVSLVAENR